MSSFGRHGLASNDLARLKNYDDYLDSILIRLESIESSTSQHFPHWRESIFNFQHSQWVEALQMNNSLEQVTVDMSVDNDSTLWRPKSIKRFMEAIGAIPTLERLILRHNNLGSPQGFVPAMTSAVEGARCLTCLELHWTHVSPVTSSDLESLANAIQRCKELQTLTLKGNQTNESTVQAFNTVLTNKTLKKLCIGNVTSAAFRPFLDDFPSNSTLETLKIIFRDSVEDSTCERLADIFIPSRSLKSLLLLSCNLPDPCFGEKGQQHLLRLAENNCYIREMTVAGASNTSIDFFVRLNCAGRRKLFQEGAVRTDWVDVMSCLVEDLDSLFYVLLLNPALCDTTVQ